MGSSVKIEGGPEKLRSEKAGYINGVLYNRML
jgi:hypothetical protein